MALAEKDLPQAVECEIGALSAMWQGGDVSIGEAFHVIGVNSSEWFHVPGNGKLYSAIVSNWQKGKSLDPVAFTQQLRDEKKLDELGGAGHLTMIYGFSIPAMLQTYLEQLSDKRWLRIAHQTGVDIAKRTLHDQHDAEGILRDVELSLMKLSQRHASFGKQRSIREITTKVIENLEDPEKALGISTGFPNLDGLVGGLAPHAKIVIAGRTSTGKSAFAANIALSLALRNISVVVFTFEMSAEQWVKRIIQIHARTSARKVVGADVDMFDVNKFANAASEISKTNLIVTDDRLDTAGIRARCLQLKPKVAIIDYLQIMPDKRQKNENRTDQLDRMSSDTKQIAHQLEMNVIELSQLTHDEKTGTYKTKGSTSITNDSDQLWTIEGEDDETKDVIHKDIVVPKQREGPRGRIPFNFHKPTTRFTEKN